MADTRDDDNNNNSSSSNNDINQFVAGSSAPALPFTDARLAFSIIEVLLQVNGATNDLVAIMAQVLDEDTKHALTNTPVWQNYLDARRALHGAQDDLERFSEAIKALEPAEN